MAPGWRQWVRRSEESAGSGSEQKGVPLLPVLQDVLLALPAADVSRLRLSDRRLLAASDALRPQVLSRRGLSASCSWQKAQAVEEALFCDRSGDPCIWTPGPNKHGVHNVLEQKDAGSDHWLALSGGTDWQGFQGGFRRISEDGIQPSWVAFRVRVETPALSGAFLTLSGEQEMWGLSDPVLVFSYRGDDCSSNRRCFMVQTSLAQQCHGNDSRLQHACYPNQQPVDGSRAHEVAMNLDWNTGTMSVFIDGKQHVHGARFKPPSPIRYMALYNWRSGARTAFSELLLGTSCPFALERGAALGRPRLRGPCCRRHPAAVKAPALSVPPREMMAFGVGLVAVVVGLALQSSLQLL